MPSTYSSSLRLELQATGENANTWGVKTNNNLNLIEQAIAGYVKITLVSASATYNLDIADASASNGRNAFIEFVGTAASAISIVVPDVEKGYWVKNSVTGASLTFRTSGGTGFNLPRNQWILAVADGVSAVNATPVSATTLVAGIVKLADTTAALAGTDSATGMTPETTKAVASRIIQNIQASAYSLVLADAGKHIFHPATATSTATYIVPSNASVAFPIGTVITLINHPSAGPIDVSITTDTLYYSFTGSAGSRQVAAAGMVALVKITDTQWIISGTGIT